MADETCPPPRKKKIAQSRAVRFSPDDGKITGLAHRFDSHVYVSIPAEHFMQIQQASREPREFGIGARRGGSRASRQPRARREEWVTGNCRLAKIQCR